MTAACNTTGPPRRIDRRQSLLGLCGTGAASLLPTRTYGFQSDMEANEAEEVPLYVNLFTRLATPVYFAPPHRSLFVLDTGSQATSLSDRLARQMALPSGPEVVVHTVTASVRAPTVVLPRLRVQGLVFENVLTPVFPYEELGAPGLLGLNHLRHFTLTLDVLNLSATLNPTTRRSPVFDLGGPRLATRIERRLTPVRSRAAHGLVLMEIQVGSVATTAFLDTGSQYSIGNLKLLQSLGIPPSATRDTSVQGVIGPPMLVKTGPSPTLQLGPKRLERIPLHFADLHIFDVLGLTNQPALLLGADILTMFDRIGLDYSTSRISLGSVVRYRRR
ncbi:retroviral-like aspartic protease family protein [uncultured Brevundimonas sp.]|uniref:retroviral-like aspartic protease family protein n=1 Tax=uncultured Brevundimonas sp. TaxID=213418 RepID=UPI002621A6E8|nr:retroviral-like aspartic protease family protein [uncultured Brevundimonas sp.]